MTLAGETENHRTGWPAKRILAKEPVPVGIKLFGTPLEELTHEELMKAIVLLNDMSMERVRRWSGD